MISFDDFFRQSGIAPDSLDDWIMREWLVRDDDIADRMLAEVDVARAHMIRDLQDGFGVNNEGIDIILHLLDQLHGLRHAMGQVRSEFTIRSLLPLRELEAQDID